MVVLVQGPGLCYTIYDWPSLGPFPEIPLLLSVMEILQPRGSQAQNPHSLTMLQQIPGGVDVGLS